MIALLISFWYSLCIILSQS